ncbi:MAG: recombinase family protein [Bdellovibrionia bacterium]
MSRHELRGVCYVRYGNFGPTKEKQLEGLLDYVESHQIHIIKFFEDVDADEGRPEFRQLVDYVKRESADVLIVWRLDRLDFLARSFEKTFYFVSELEANRLRFVSVVDDLDSGKKAGPFVSGVIKAVTQARNIIRGENVHKSLETARSLGEPVGRPRIRNDEKIRKLKSEGLSVRQIARTLHLSAWTVQKSLKSTENQDLSP